MKRIWLALSLLVCTLCLAIAAGCDNKPKILDAPQNIRVENNILIWDEVEHANGYAVYFSELEEERETEKNYVDFSAVNFDITLEVEILAVGDGVDYLDSDWVKYECVLTKQFDPAYGLTYQLTEDKSGYKVSGVKEELGEELYIPDYYEGLPVKEISKSAFESNYVTKDVRLPSTLEKIEKNAFCNFTALGIITIPEGVTFIGENAFAGCTSALQVSLPTTLETIETDAFQGCAALRNIIMPEGLKTIGGFRGCTGLQTLSFPASLQSIDDSAFRGCTSLRALSFPVSLQTIGSSAFRGCTSLQTPSFPASLQTIGSSAFNRCTNLRALSFPASLQSIGSYAFLRCTALTSVSFSEDASIGIYAFKGCTALTNVTFSEGVSIGSSAFSGCTALTEIDCSPCSAISYYAFENCASLTEIAFPEDAHNYSARSFASTGWYENQPNGYIIVNGDTLYHYKGDVPNGGVIVEFPSEIKKIADCAFTLLNFWDSTGSNVVSISIPDGVELCGSHIFDTCESLQFVKLPGGITEILPETFAGCVSLESIEIPEGVTKIGSMAFSYCTKLTEIKLPSTLVEIGKSAFNNCSSLKKLYLPDSLKIVDYYEFNASTFEEIVLPVSLNSIRSSRFNEDTKIYYRGTKEEWNEYFAEANYNGTVFYYVEVEADVPADGGNYWRFVDGVPTVWQ